MIRSNEVRWFVVLVLSVAPLAACGPKHKNQCAGNATSGCVNGEVCSFDRKLGCQVCQCRPWDQTDTGQDPDDPNPPVPVH